MFLEIWKIVSDLLDRFLKWKTGKAHVKIELYEKRYTIYQSLIGFLEQIVTKGMIAPETVFKFTAETAESKFLFDDPIRKYLKEIADNAMILYGVEQKYSILPIGSERSRLVDKKWELQQWFEQQTKIASSKFDKFLNLKDL